MLINICGLTLLACLVMQMLNYYICFMCFIEVLPTVSASCHSDYFSSLFVAKLP